MAKITDPDEYNGIEIVTTTKNKGYSTAIDAKGATMEEVYNYVKKHLRGKTDEEIFKEFYNAFKHKMPEELMKQILMWRCAQEI